MKEETVDVLQVRRMSLGVESEGETNVFLGYDQKKGRRQFDENLNEP